ncbi:MAG: lipoprotein [Steroidobacteraceae bacterium]
MRVVSALALVTVAAGCGQTGSLYLPDESVETPVEIRTPATPADDDEEEKKSTQPPGR